MSRTLAVACGAGVACAVYILWKHRASSTNEVEDHAPVAFAQVGQQEVPDSGALHSPDFITTDSGRRTDTASAEPEFTAEGVATRGTTESGRRTDTTSAEPEFTAEGVVTRRVVNADNNCLFTSVAYCMEGTRDKWHRLREVIAETIRADPLTYNEAVLGKPIHEYCSWIMDPANWGGYIELAILSAHYRVEIRVVHLQHLTTQAYGEGAGFKACIYLMYDGLHYDPFAFAASECDSEKNDRTLFSVHDSMVTAGAMQCALELHDQRKFTDTSAFPLLCAVCYEGVTGTSGAEAHAKLTGHQNFMENGTDVARRS